MKKILPVFFQVAMPIGYKYKDGKVVIADWLWNLPGLMLSAYFWHKDVLYEKKNNNLMIDSGGFSFGGKEKIHLRREFLDLRERLYRWQCLYGDYIICGDIPPSLTKDFDFIKECLVLTMDNIDLQFKLGAEGRFVNVVHGHSFDIIRFWYKGVKFYPSIGWALGSSIKTTVFGFALQLLSLYELGEFREKVKVIHCLGAVGKQIVVGLHYLVSKLGIDTDMLSFDASSSSAERFGNMVDEDGTIVSFSEIRDGRKQIELWNGEILTTVPTRLTGEFKIDVTRTNMLNSDKAWNKNIIQMISEGGEEYEQLVDTSGARIVYALWKDGGIAGLEKELDRRGFMGRVRAIEQKDMFKIL